MRIKEGKGVRASIDAVSAMCLLERYVEDEVVATYICYLCFLCFLRYICCAAGNSRTGFSEVF